MAVALVLCVGNARTSFRIGAPMCVLALACDAQESDPNAMPFTQAATVVDAAAPEVTAPAPPAAPETEALFLALLPDLRDACGGCHAQGTLAPLWLAPPDAYASVRAYDGIVTPNPAASKLLVKGRHSGPAPSASLRERLEAWLVAEAKGLAAAAPISTGPISLSRGPNVIDLSRVAGAPAGTALTFDAQWTTAGARLKLTAVTLAAPATAGVHVIHPTFGAARDHAFASDPIDAFSTVDQTIAAGQSGVVGDGLLYLEDWESADALEIRFASLAPAP